MELSELTAYAEEKFHMQEQHKWEDFPGFSVLADPNTGKWVALLMRQWDSDRGEEMQWCDIKCGRQIFSEIQASYLTVPFRMKGSKWVGVVFDSRTQPEVVFRLFDRAVYSLEEQQGFTIVLDTPPVEPMVVYQDTALPAADMQFALDGAGIPEKIRWMMRMYEYKEGSFAQKCRNFCRQGKFMEDYEDDAPWDGVYKRYFPTYHDLNIKQLRGYFTWRTRVRKGEFSPISASLAYIYVYELLNGIGTASPEDGLKKMREFEIGFLDSGVGDPGMRKNLRRWMLEYAVLHDVPAALAIQYADPDVTQKDAALAVLKGPKESADEELFSALCFFLGKKLEQSPVVKKNGERGKHLFAAVWRYALESCLQEGKDLFAACFGQWKSFSWRPLANAVYWEEHPHPDFVYELDACRMYRCQGGQWQEMRYDNLYFDREKFRALLHETDRQLRSYLKTGHYLHENPNGAWAAPYVKRILEEDRQAQIEAAKPQIKINLSNLDQIRQEALLTRDSLLTEEEMGEAAEEGRVQKTPEPVLSGQEYREKAETGHAEREQAESEWVGKAGEAPWEEPDSMSGTFMGLDAVHRQILRALLEGKSAEPYIRANHLMPAVVADTINEAFFDEIGDTILACDGDVITVVEDYLEDVLQMSGEEK